MPIPIVKRIGILIRDYLEEDSRFKGTDSSSIEQMNSEVRLHRVCFNTDSPEENGMLKVYYTNSGERAGEVYNIRNKTPKDSNLVNLMTSNPICISKRDELYGILMELYFGNLWSGFLLPNGPLNEKQFLILLKHLVMGVGELHKIGIVHSDIKPTNILATDPENPTWHLSDFGSAIMRNSFSYDTLSGKNALCFQSPELREGLLKTGKFVYDPAEDIFQIGVSLYIALKAKATGFQEDFSLFNQGRNYRQFLDDSMKKIDYGSVIRTILKMFLGPKRPKILPRGKTWKDYRYTLSC